MRAVIQKVLHANVVVDGKVISEISRGLMVLVGIGTDDTPSDSAYLVKKILNLRLFAESDEDGSAMWKKSVMDVDGGVLCVSQFTLMARTEKGTKPDFHGAMSTEAGRAFYSSFLEEMRKAYKPGRIQDGQFGAMMQVSLCNDGPITITLDSRNTAGKPASASVSGSATPNGTSGADAEERAAAKLAAREKKRMAVAAHKQAL